MLVARPSLLAAVCAACLALGVESARADGTPASPVAPVAPVAPAPTNTHATSAPVLSPPAMPEPPPPVLPPSKGPTFALNGYVETAYTYSFNQPSNGIIQYHGFDDRHNTFTIQNAVLDATGTYAGLSARVALQVGSTPATYYSAEPNLPGSNAVGPSTPDYWRFLQQAYGGYTVDVRQGLTLEAGIFLSPIGPEVVQAKDDWNYSRSNEFMGLPFYHTGVRATLQITDRTSVALWVVNGWNSVVDNNPGKSVIGVYTYKIPDRFLLQLLYMGGPERNAGAPEGQPMRNLFDAYAQLDVNSVLSFLAQGDTGFEKNTFGISWWATGAGYVRVHPVRWLYLAGRGDYFAEHRGADATGTASPIFFASPWVASGTGTFDARPHDNVSLRLEYRHDQSGNDLYFSGTVKGNGTTTAYVPNATAQNTVTAAALAWF